MSKDNKRGGFTFYRSFYEAIETKDTGLSDSNKCELYRAICEYALNGNEPDFKGVMSLAWNLIFPNLKSSRKKSVNNAGGAPIGNNNARKNNEETTKKQRRNNEETTIAIKDKDDDEDKDNNIDKDEDKDDDEDKDVLLKKARKKSFSASDEAGGLKKTDGLKKYKKVFEKIYKNKIGFVFGGWDEDPNNHDTIYLTKIIHEIVKRRSDARKRYSEKENVKIFDFLLNSAFANGEWIYSSGQNDRRFIPKNIFHDFDKYFNKEWIK